MPRRPTLAETLADDTGRIRPEVADLLMEGPTPAEIHAHQRYRPVLQEVPPESLLGGICIFLGLMIFFTVCLWIISYRLSSKATIEEEQVSNSGIQTEETSEQTTTNTQAPPLPNQEKVQNGANEVTKKLEEEAPKSVGTQEDSNSFNNSQCGIRKESFSPATNREEVEQPVSNKTNSAPNVKDESESPRQGYQYNPPERPPTYRYRENSGNFTRRQYGYPYPYRQPYYVPPIIRYRIPACSNPYYFGPIQGIGPYDRRSGGRRYIVIFRRRYR